MQTFEHTGDKSYVEFDAAGKPRAESDAVDPEAQVISGDFKRPPY
jgi:hypothetical protein